MQVIVWKDIQAGSPHHRSPDVGAHFEMQVIIISMYIVDKYYYQWYWWSYYQ